jgi:putative ABC transport system permease protein
MKSFLKSSNAQMINFQVGHIRIAHQEFLRLERVMPGEYLVDVDRVNRVNEAISRVPNVEASFKRLKFNVLLNRQGINERGIAIGIDPLSADKGMKLSQTLTAGNYNDFDANGQGLIIGIQLAKKLNVTINDEILLVANDINYSTYALPFKIVCIFQTGYAYMDNHILFIPLKKAGEMLDCGDAVHEILVFLKEPGKSEAAAETIQQAITDNKLNSPQPIQVIPWQKDEFVAGFMPYLEDLINNVLYILLILVTLVILNTMLMAVMERYHEIGVLKALGFKDKEVRVMIMVEALFMGLVGSAAGGIVGGTLAAISAKTGIDFSKGMGEELFNKMDELPVYVKVLYPEFSFSIIFSAILFGLVIALVASLYPAFKSSKMSPVEALRSELKV